MKDEQLFLLTPVVLTSDSFLLTDNLGEAWYKNQG